MPLSSRGIDSQIGSSWSVRILLLASAGILFLTLFPFRFAVPDNLAQPVLITGMGKTGSTFDQFLNVLLFVPFGFGLAEMLRERGKSKQTVILAALAAGALFSYTIETLQIYVPTRDSGWGDVFTNTAGCLFGAAAFEAIGAPLLRAANRGEAALALFFTPGIVAGTLALYFAVWLTVSFQLQQRSRLADWLPNSLLLVGNDAATHSAWGGQLLRLEIWDEALPANYAAALTSGSTSLAPRNLPHAITAYDFSAQPPAADRAGLLPPISGKPAPATPYDSDDPNFDGVASPALQTSATSLVEALQRTNHFSLHLVCRPAAYSSAPARILWIAPQDGAANLAVRQEGANFVFWFRNPLSAQHAGLTYVIGDLFASGKTRDVVITYDGAQVSFFVDGRRLSRLYRLGPGAAIVWYFRWLRPAELEAYSDLYYAIVFIPAGVVLGVARRNTPSGQIATRILWLLVIVAPPLLLEACLIAASGRRLQVGRVVLSFAMLVAGALWINAGRSIRRPAAT